MPGSECVKCGYIRQRRASVCTVDRCGQYADIFPNGLPRCWEHYHEQNNLTCWIDEVFLAELKERGPSRPGEPLSSYMAREGIRDAAFERIPGEDDDL